MQYCLEELFQKEVIHQENGEKLGFIDDVQLDTDRCVVSGYLIRGRRFLGKLPQEADLFIPCDAVRLYGKDVILVDAVQELSAECTKTRLFRWRKT